ncbi:uncharacterized protein LOC108481187 [Gossypium arboreum]|uniref:uncharacterized protein LOC108481187 n=1 Tax=Gossypium arboreum TaxID=29729 RepID=UPI0022F1A17D|nr:uncharacterized protein LOC108481187 [Gossypium arboreum]
MVAELQEKETTKCFFAVEIDDKKTILITGGAGFIGTHTMVQLLNEGFKVSIIDNHDNSIIEAIDRVKKLVGPELSKKLQFNLESKFFSIFYSKDETFVDDLRNRDDLDKLFSKTKLLRRVSVTLVSNGLLGSPMVQWKNYFGEPNQESMHKERIRKKRFEKYTFRTLKIGRNHFCFNPLRVLPIQSRNRIAPAST